MATRQPELTLLVVGRHAARLAGLRLEYTGETHCPASAADLAALLDRRPADTLIFLSHGDLADSLLDYLKRRGKPLPATVISLSDGLGGCNPQLAAALRRSGDGADPRDLLAQLFEVLGMAQSASQAPSAPEPPAAQEAQSHADVGQAPSPVSGRPEAGARTADAAVPHKTHDQQAGHLQVVLERRLAESSQT